MSDARTRNIVFVCLSCERANSVEIGMDDAPRRVTTFNTLTAAFEHLHDVSQPYTHEIVARIEDEQ